MHGDSKVVRVVYTNWKGETSIRHIIPIEILFGSNEWHAEEQWLLVAFDLDKEMERTFALKDIHTWKGALGCPTAPTAKLAERPGTSFKGTHAEAAQPATAVYR